MQLPAGSENTIGRKELGKGVVQAVHLATDIFPVVTSLPVVNVVDGQIVFFQAGDGIQWMLRYNAESTSAYKWEFVGGPSLSAEYNADDTTTSTSLVALANPLSITTPLSGVYDLRHTVRQFYSVGGPGVGTVQSAIYIDGVLANAYITSWDSQLDTPVTGANERKGVTLVAGNVVQQRSQTAGGTTGTFGYKTMTLSPVRVG